MCVWTFYIKMYNKIINHVTTWSVFVEKKAQVCPRASRSLPTVLASVQISSLETTDGQCFRRSLYLDLSGLLMGSIWVCTFYRLSISDTVFSGHIAHVVGDNSAFNVVPARGFPVKLVFFLFLKIFFLFI